MYRLDKLCMLYIRYPDRNVYIYVIYVIYYFERCIPLAFMLSNNIEC